MTLDARTLASGTGWYVQDVLCAAGPHDRPYEERHETVSVAAVMSGTFQYRTAQGSALLAPGAVLLGNHGSCFECSHAHGVGDRCLAFHFAPDYWEDLAAGVQGSHRGTFTVPRLPPVQTLVPVMARLEVARKMGPSELEEIALEFASAVLVTERGQSASSRRPTAREERCVSEAIRRIEESAHDLEDGQLSLGELARQVSLSPCHFLRTFRALVGMTPHQYVLRTRMNRAAVRLRLSDEPVSTIALEAGFNDLSTFNRRFRSLMGSSPTIYRNRRTANRL